MHLKSATLHPDRYPTRDAYPFDLPLFHRTMTLPFAAPVTLFVGENGTGKSTLLEALARRCGIHIWRDRDRRPYRYNRYEESLSEHLTIEWAAERVQGAFFGSDIFQHFAQLLDEWAASDPGQLEYFGGKSLTAQSHGQSLMSFFGSRCRRPGLYLLDEPETALSPRSQLQLLELLAAASSSGRAQFIIATHSPIVMACPGAVLYSFDSDPVATATYEETGHYRLYKAFLNDRSRFLPAKD